jgi:hypothetical protein
MTEHSPLPWEDGTNHNGDPEWVFSSGAVVADCGFFSNDAMNRANAALIVLSVNLLPEVLAALEAAEAAHEALTGRVGYFEFKKLEEKATELRRAVLQKARQP